jgi:mRNA interferase MazF
MVVKRGEIYFADLGDKSENRGSEQRGLRPILIIQNNLGNEFSPTVIAAAITSSINKARLKTHVELDDLNDKLEGPTVILCEQIRTIDKCRLKEKIGYINKKTMEKINQALSVSMGL